MCILIIVSGFFVVNSVNTRALSPIGNSEDNYDMVSEEFGEDFEEFIRDEAVIKVYTGEEGIGDETIKVSDTEIRIKNENIFVKGILNVTNKIVDAFGNVKDELYRGFEDIKGNIKKYKNNNVEENNVEGINGEDTEELDKIIEDFINNNN